MVKQLFIIQILEFPISTQKPQQDQILYILAIISQEFVRAFIFNVPLS